jgi:hypothetical protein
MLWPPTLTGSVITMLLLKNAVHLRSLPVVTSAVLQAVVLALIIAKDPDAAPSKARTLLGAISQIVAVVVLAAKVSLAADVLKLFRVLDDYDKERM